MIQTIFSIKKMDCPSEEQMIRMKLSEFQSIKQLSFDLTNRILTILHEGDLDKIETAINSFQFDASIVESKESQAVILNTNDSLDKNLLWIVFGINFSFFILEIFFGLLANSMGLIADSFDMLADSFVYALSIFAITGTLLIKKRIARISGLLQFALSLVGFAEVIRRFIGYEDIPNYAFMISISFLALLANTASLILLSKSKTEDIHIKSSQIFTSNDVIANIGVIIAGVLVLFFNSKTPDLVVGFIVFLFVFRGAIRIFQLSK